VRLALCSSEVLYAGFEILFAWCFLFMVSARNGGS
jgi:hypothetical protein